MGNWKLTRAQEPQALTEPVLREMRHGQVGRAHAPPAHPPLHRRGRGPLAPGGLGRHAGLPVAQPGARGFGGQINLGTIETVDQNPEVKGLTLADGAPAYFPQARTFVQLIDPNLGFQNGDSPDGSGTTTNVRTMWQKCPHLGCKPNFCDINYWFECPCHGSRYDRLGTKVQELGPAPRGLDRFAHVVQNGELIVDTGTVILGPLPVALGQPGLIPAKSPGGCI